MRIWSRQATPDDIETIVPLYRALEEEQTALRPMWRLADGLPEPPETKLKAILDDEESLLVLGLLDETPLGFAWARVQDLLPQAGGERVAMVALIHTDQGARGVGIGEAMLTLILERFRERGITKFDAKVSPGHRNAKNFFEASGFKARLIVMHHDDDA